MQNSEMHHRFCKYPIPSLLPAKAPCLHPRESCFLRLCVDSRKVLWIKKCWSHWFSKAAWNRQALAGPECLLGFHLVDRRQSHRRTSVLASNPSNLETKSSCGHSIIELSHKYAQSASSLQTNLAQEEGCPSQKPIPV